MRQTTTSSEPAELATHHYINPPENNHAPKPATEALLKEEATTGFDDAERLESIVSDQTSMFNKKDDDPALLLSAVDEQEMIRFRRFKSPTFCRWCNNIRLQWRILFYLIVGLAILLLLFAAMNRDTSTSSRLEDMSKTGFRITAIIQEEKATIGRPTTRVKVDVYMESQCPDTADFLDSQLMPTWSALKEYMDLKIVPFGKARWSQKGGDDYSFQCQHGQNECLVNQLMCCGIEQLKIPELYVPYVVCLQMTSLGDEEEAKCDQRAHLSHQQMQDCANSKHGRHLHYRMGNLTKSLQPPLYFVPWILIDGRRDSAAISDLKLVICKRLFLFGVKPSACDTVATAISATPVPI